MVTHLSIGSVLIQCFSVVAASLFYDPQLALIGSIT